MASPAVTRQFCGSCGWPVDGPACTACGAERMTIAPEPAGRRLTTEEVVTDPAGLEGAVGAWRARDFVAMIGHAVAALAPDAVAAALPDGPGWRCSVRSATLFIGVHSSTGELRIEAPVARLPKRQRVPVLRAALELCSEPRSACRVCVRGELLVMRFVARLSMMTPMAIQNVTRDMVAACARLRGDLSAFDARAPFRDVDGTELGWELLGQPRLLEPLAPASGHAAHDAAPDEFLETPSRRHTYTPMPESDGLPAVLGGFGGQPPGQPVDRGDAMRLPREVAAGPRATIPDIDVDIPLRRRSTMRFQTDELAITPADRLCELLRQAQALATSLSFGPAPELMLLVVRAAIFRAICEFGEEVPDAVAHLYREAFAVTRPPWETGPSRRFRSLDIPVAEPALLVMGEIVRQRAEVEPEPPLVLEPLTSAPEVRELLARYTAEIERAPDDLLLRHFLALGALTEVLVRTKLPPKTKDRLREIVRLAKRDGPKKSAIDLVMRTIAKIIGG